MKTKNLKMSEVIERFGERLGNPNEGDKVVWEAATSNPTPPVYCRDDVMWSYGDHFPLAKYLGTREDGTHWFVKNGDPYSRTTAEQQGMMQNVCPGPTLSASAIRLAGIEMIELGPENIVDVREDERIELIREGSDESAEPWYRCDRDLGGDSRDVDFSKLEPFKLRGRPGMLTWTYPYRGKVYGGWHVLGAVLLRHEGRLLLCSLDEGSYFVSEIPEEVDTVEAAFSALEPRESKKAKMEGKKVLRQGEWFFVETGLDDKGLRRELGLKNIQELRKLAEVKGLPVVKEESNRHVVRHLVDEAGTTWATGAVRHRIPISRVENQEDLVESCRDIMEDTYSKALFRYSARRRDRFWGRVRVAEEVFAKLPRRVEYRLNEKITETIALVGGESLTKSDWVTRVISEVEARNHEDGDGSYVTKHDLGLDLPDTKARLSGEHQSVKLGKTWWKVYRNRELGAWSGSEAPESMGGRQSGRWD